MLGLFHARKLRAHELALKLGWDRSTSALGLTKPFYDRFTPAIAASDFALGRATSTARSTSSPSAMAAERRGAAGDLAIVLHSHMPYVEGFGTYPFGEEWLFDAVIRSYLPVLEVAARPDDDGDPGARRPARGRRRDGAAARASSSSGGSARPRLTSREVAAECRPACEAEQERYRHALELLDAAGGDPLRPFQRAAAEGRVALAASAATHAVLPLLATREGLRLQLDAGHPLAPAPLRLGRRLLAARVRLCAGARVAPGRAGRGLVLRRPERPEQPLDALAPIATEAGPVALPIDWEAISWLWSLDGYPSDPAHAQFAGKSLRGMRIWKVGGGAYDPAAAAAVARRQAGEFLAADGRAPARATAASRGRRGLLVFAIDTELLGHWWSEGPIWLREVLDGAEAAGVRLLTVPEALAEHEPLERPLRASTWGEEKDLRTWDSPPVADLAWGARRLELRLLRALSRGLARRRGRARRARAARRSVERLGLPRPARPGRRLCLPARHRPRRGALEAIDSGRRPTRACARWPRT